MSNNHLLYHISHYENLASILQRGCLSAHSNIQKETMHYTNIAHHGLQSRRSTTSIPVKPMGILHDYVPFYFAPRSPMLYAIKQGRVEGFSGNQNDILYLVTRTDIMERTERPFVFTDGHGIMFITEFYNHMKDLNKVDWDMMKEWYWSDTEEDPDRKRRRQAEFLVYQFVKLEHFLGIGVRTEKMKSFIEEMLREHSIDLPVLVRPKFYF